MTRAESGGLSALRHETGRGMAVTDCLGVDVRPRLESVKLWAQGPHPVSSVATRTFEPWLAGVALAGAAAAPAKTPVARTTPATSRVRRLKLVIGHPSW